MDDYIFQFQFMQEIKGSPVEEYLNARRITQLPTLGLRYEPTAYESETKSRMPAICAAMTNSRMKIAYFHRTYLDGSQKAKGINGKKIFTAEKQIEVECQSCGASLSAPACIRLFNCDDTMGIAEGIETALSAAQIYSMPVWSTANALYMKSFDTPKSVKNLYIFADNDKNGTGLAAAFECGRRAIVSNSNSVEKVTIRTPLQVPDFNDMLFTQSETHDWILTGKTT